MKTKFNTIFDTIGIILLSFLLIFSWIKFYTKQTLLATLVSVILSTIIGIVAFNLFSKRSHTAALKKDEQERIDKLSFYLNHMSSKDVVQYFFANCTLAEKPQITPVGIMFGTYKKYLFVPYFSSKILDKATILASLDWAYYHQIAKVIFCYGEIDNRAINFSKEFFVVAEFWDITKLYREKGVHLVMPLCPHLAPTIKKSKKQIFSDIFSKMRVKNYLLFGIFTMILSYIVPFKLYYLIAGSVLIAFAFFILFFRRNKNPT